MSVVRLIAIGLFLAAFGAGPALSDAKPRLVFAHYMVCCPRAGPNVTVEDFEAEIREARAVGIDGFALNCGEWNTRADYPNNSKMLFEAARRVGPEFKLFFSADQSGQLTPGEAADMVVSYRAHPNQLRRDGKVVLSSFVGNSEWVDAVRAKVRERVGDEIFVVPFFFPPSGNALPNGIEIRTLAERNPGIDGFFYFGASGNADQLARSIRSNAAEWARHGKLFMAGVTPYYRGLRGNYRIFESQGYEGLMKQWMAAIETDTEWVEIVTWNDWAEATYIAPLTALNPTSRTMELWGRLLTHQGYLEASRYFIDWFKTRREPPVRREQLFFAYRLHPKNAFGQADPLVARNARPNGANLLADQVHVFVLLQHPAVLILRNGPETYRRPLSAGMNFVSVPLTPGDVAFALLRDGVVIAEMKGEFPIRLGSDWRDGNWANFNVYTGKLDVVPQ